MLNFFAEVTMRYKQKLAQAGKLYTVRKGEEETESSNAEDVNVNITYQEILHLSLEILSVCAKNTTKEFCKEMREMINALEVKMNNLFQDVTTISTEIEFNNIIVFAIAYCNIGDAYSSLNDLFTAKEHFERCIELLKKKELHRKAILIAIQVRLKLTTVLQLLKKSKNYFLLLDEAMELYLNYTEGKDEYPDPIDLINILFPKKDMIESTSSILIDHHLTTLGCLGLQYTIYPKDKHKFVKYVHNLLNKELIEDFSTGNKPSISWADTSACLSIYFIRHERFMEAKSFLVAADYVRRAHKSMLKDQNYSESSEEYINYKRVHAHIIRYWGIYGITILQSSKTKLQHESDKSCEANIKPESLTKSETELMKPLMFIDLEKELGNSEITHTYVSDCKDAKVIFTKVLQWLNQAKTVYAKYDFQFHVDTILNISRAYKHYIYFAENRNKRKKLIKLQIKILENAVNTLTSQLTSDGYRHYKELYMDLANTYSKLLNMRYEEFNEIKVVTDEMKMELKQLIKNILDNYNLYTKET